MDDDLTGLDEALRAALGPDSPLWNGEGETEGDMVSTRDIVVHGVRRRRIRRLRAVIAVIVVVVVIGLVISQVAGASPARPGHRGGAMNTRPAMRPLGTQTAVAHADAGSAALPS